MENSDTLQKAGFKELRIAVFPFLWFVSRESRICFERGAVEDAERKWLGECVKEKVPAGICVFYYAHGTPQDERGCEEILAALGLTELRPEMRLINPTQ